jgi:pimeloyl-ACP methyl ester carboxylesterase
MYHLPVPLIAAVLFISALSGGCGTPERQTTQPEPAAAGAAPGVGSAASASADGAPRIANGAGGVHIEYQVYGRGEPALLFIHGWSCDSNYWRAQIEEFRERYTVVALDLGGHGASGRNRGDWSMASFGEDVAAVAREIPNEELVLIGHSMGGPVALEAAAALKDRLIGIIGVDTFRAIGAPATPKAQSDEQLAPFRADFVGATRKFVPTFFTKDADPALVQKIAYDMSLAPPEVAVPAIMALNEMDYPRALAGIRVPIVAVNADFAPTDEAQIRKLAPTFRLIEVSGLGHFLMMEDPPHVNAILERELRSMVRR